jgi:FkbM family methyltransferase
VKILAPDGDPIGKYIQNSGEYYEQDLLEDSKKYISTGDVIVDVGANIGNHTLYWSFFKCHIYAFEPNPKTFSYLTSNCENNEKSNVVCHCIALYDKSGTGQLIETENAGECRVKYGKGEIEFRTLDSYGLAPRIVKIDVEGCEMNVLKGAVETLMKFHPILYVEIKERLHEFDSFLLRLGYVRHEVYGFTPTYKYI